MRDNPRLMDEAQSMCILLNVGVEKRMEWSALGTVFPLGKASSSPLVMFYRICFSSLERKTQSREIRQFMFCFACDVFLCIILEEVIN